MERGSREHQPSDSPNGVAVMDTVPHRKRGGAPVPEAVGPVVNGVVIQEPVADSVKIGRAGGHGRQRRKATRGRDMRIADAWRHQPTEVAALMTNYHLESAAASNSTLSDDHDSTADYPAGVSIYSPTILQENLEHTTERFYTMREDTFLGTRFRIRRDPLRTAAEISSLPPHERTESMMTLRNVRILLGINSFNELPSVFKESQSSRKRRSERTHRLLAVRYGVMGSLEDIRNTFNQYGEAANNVINSLRKSELSEEASALEMINDVRSTNDPLDLLLMTIDDRYTPQPRFEAKRKLEFMRLIADIQLRERRYGFSQQKAQLNEFLTNHVYTQEERKGQTTVHYFLATFDPETWETISVRVLDQDQVDPKVKTYKDSSTGETKTLDENQKLLTVPRRTFTYRERARPIYATDPDKELERKALKVIRKGVENPTQVIDDDVRMMGVFDSYADAQDFIAHIQEQAAKAGSLVTFEQIEDTLQGGVRRDENGAVANGGDKGYRVLKFHGSFALPGKMPIYAEFQLHINETWTDYQYKVGTAHDEFSVKRFFGKDDEIGAGDLLFPYRHYRIDMKLARERKLALIRGELNRYGR